MRWSCIDRHVCTVWHLHGSLLPGVPLSFAEVEEAVRLTQQTALGYIRCRAHQAAISSLAKGGHKNNNRRHTAVLGPPASHTTTFDEHDRIVVIAQDYNV